MKINVYSIKDEKVCFTGLITNRTDGAARREFAIMINNPQQGAFNFAPSDFALYRIGMFDYDKGILEPISPIELVCTGKEVFNETE